MTKKILGFVKTETAQAIAILFVIGLILWAVGCESEVRSLSDPETMVTRSQLSAEWQVMAMQYESRFVDLDKQDAFRTAFFNQLALYTQTGVINPAGIVAAIVGVLGVAAVADNVKKRGEVKTLKKNNGVT